MRQYCTLQQLQCQPSQLIIVHIITQSFANFFSHSLVCSVLILVPGFNAAKRTKAALTCKAGVGYPVCKGLQAIYNPNQYYISERELQLRAQIPRYLRIFYHDIHRSSSASKNTKHEMSSVWLLHQPVICFKTKGFIKKLTAPHKNCQLEIRKIYVSSPAPRYLSRMS